MAQASLGRPSSTFLDTESGLYYYRARTYDPKVGRFLQQDPLPPRPLEMNVYVYVANNPVNFIDPMGLDKEGCDRIPDFLETPCRKDACRRHDRCYAENQCDESSWKPGSGSAACKRCNARVWHDFSVCATPGPGEQYVSVCELRF